jgi:hypothetical protein
MKIGESRRSIKANGDKVIGVGGLMENRSKN